MQRKIKYRDTTWIDLESPTPAEVEALGREFDLPPLILNELAAPSLRSKVDTYSDFIYLALHFPFCQICYGQAGLGERDYQEVDFILGRNFIITTHYEEMPVLNDFGKILESDFGAKRHQGEVHAGFIFYYIIREIYREMEAALDFTNSRLKTIEKKVFSGQERAVVRELAEVSRTLLDFRWAFKSHKEAFASLEVAGEELYGSKFRNYLKAISGEYGKVWRAIQSNRSTFGDLRETNDSLLSIKTNETIKVLTVTAFIMLPLTILSQIFSMNAEFMPIVGGTNDFYKILSLMAVIVAVLYFTARQRRWF